MTDWRDACAQAATAAALDPTLYVRDVATPAGSPIDTFYAASRGIITAATPGVLAAHPAFGPLFLVGLVSATENYYRDILARLVRICPLAQCESADEMIRWGSVVWHRGVDMERGAFEQISFTSLKNVRDTLKSFLGYTVAQHGDIVSLAKEFERACEIRHAIVHSGNVVAGKNALKLSLPPAAAGTMYITVGFSELQQSASICTNLVLATNRELFAELCKRWALGWRTHPSWSAAKENERFAEIWRTFFSAIDHTQGQLAHMRSEADCRADVLAEFL